MILGGGISGLSCAWFLRKQYPDARITLLEKQGRLGGSIRTDCAHGFLFEKGPRTFPMNRCAALLALIREMGLEEEIILSSPQAKSRYLWHQGRLRSIGSFLPMLLREILFEPFRPKGTGDDESIHSFALRRFGPNMANILFDALTLGIYAGDSRSLSIRSCFPSLFHMERDKGSLLIPLLFSKKKQKGQGLFTLLGGMHRLIDRLRERSGVEIVLQAEVEEIQSNGVRACGLFYPADRIVSALPGSVIGALTGLWNDFRSSDLWVANLAYAEDVLPAKGFGYLIPTQPSEQGLGMIWDSLIFPQQNKTQETRVTLMMKSGGANIAHDMMQRHLRVSADPIHSDLFLVKDAIPQFFVGYENRLHRFRHEVKAKYPSLILVGNYLSGASVNDCIECSKGCIL